LQDVTYATNLPASTLQILANVPLTVNQSPLKRSRVRKLLTTERYVLEQSSHLNDQFHLSCSCPNILSEHRSNVTLISVSDFVQLDDKGSETNIVITFSVTLVILVALGIGLGVKLHYDKVSRAIKWENILFLSFISTLQKHQMSPAVRKLLEGNKKELNRQLSIEEQTEYLPYDKRWEFPRYRLKLGKCLRPLNEIYLHLY
jgi:hypothetical protein